LLQAPIVAALLALASPAVFAQQPVPGQLLYASPTLNSADFGETVLLVLVSDDQGSRAVALNRPTRVTPAEAFPDVEEVADSTDTLFFGGPVSPNLLVILFDAGDRVPQNSQRVFGNIFVTTDPAALAMAGAGGASRVRLFAGHAAWGPSQLEAEIAAGNWRLVNGSADRVFADDPAALWNSIPPAGGGISARR
jgi:putative transcriptional regulator